jgi:uncharacterized protein (UPF0332 family)
VLRNKIKISNIVKMQIKERIKEAENSVKSYLSDEYIKKIIPDNNIIRILEKNADESIYEAQKVKSSLWKIVISYYSMFYIANAVLVKLGYKVGDKIAHKVTSDALIVFVKDKLSKKLLEDYEIAQEEALAGIKADELVQSFDLERKKRGTFQYNTSETVKDSKAETSLKRAKEFIFVMKKLL